VDSLPNYPPHLTFLGERNNLWELIRERKDNMFKDEMDALTPKSSTLRRMKDLFRSTPVPENHEEGSTSSTYPLFPELPEDLEDSKNERNGSKSS